MKNRKGLSNVIATVLIILLALAAVVIMWVFVQNAVRSTASETDLRSTCLLTEVKAVACDGSSVDVQLVRGDPDTVLQVVGVISNSQGESASGEVGWPDNLDVLSSVNVPVTGVPGGTISAKAAAKVFDPNNMDRVATCDLSFESVSCGGAPAPVCGNGVIEGSEVCDGTDLGGEDCISQGFSGGTLACLSDCSGFDTTSCIP